MRQPFGSGVALCEDHLNPAHSACPQEHRT